MAESRQQKAHISFQAYLAFQSTMGRGVFPGVTSDPVPSNPCIPLVPPSGPQFI